MVKEMSKKSRFWWPFYNQQCKRAQALSKSASQHLYHIDWPLSSQLSLKTSLLLTCQILGLLVTTLAADEKYPVLNRDNLTIRIQIQLSQKQKIFCDYFPAFWNLAKILNILTKKMMLMDFAISKLRTPKT